MRRLLKIIGIGFLALIVLGVLSTALGGGGSGRATATPGAAVATAVPTQPAAAVQTAPAGGAAVPTATAAAPPKAAASTATSKPAAQTLKIGDALESKNWQVTVMAAERVDGEITWSEFGNKTAAVGQWLVLTVELRNVGSENHTLNTWDFELRTVNGQTIKHTTEILGYADFKKMTRLGRQIPPGAVVTTPLIFDIPKGAQGINLVFAQDKDRPINVA